MLGGLLDVFGAVCTVNSPPWARLLVTLRLTFIYVDGLINYILVFYKCLRVALETCISHVYNAVFKSLKLL